MASRLGVRSCQPGSALRGPNADKREKICSPFCQGLTSLAMAHSCRRTRSAHWPAAADLARGACESAGRRTAPSKSNSKITAAFMDHDTFIHSRRESRQTGPRAPPKGPAARRIWPPALPASLPSQLVSRAQTTPQFLSTSSPRALPNRATAPGHPPLEPFISALACKRRQEPECLRAPTRSAASACLAPAPAQAPQREPARLGPAARPCRVSWGPLHEGG